MPEVNDMDFEEDINEWSIPEDQISDPPEMGNVDLAPCETCGKVECSCDDDYEQWKANDMAGKENH